MKEVVLAFSGGLDTSFCVPYLREQGYEVITLFVDTGGVSDDERQFIERRAIQLGAKEHLTLDGAAEVWDDVVVPLIYGDVFYQDQYPLLVSDRYVIVKKALDVAKERGIGTFAHGCTGMGNDQVRFDLTVQALGDFVIKTPIREIQDQHENVRAYEQAYLEERGFSVSTLAAKYSINENILGVTASGSEIDEWQAPGDATYQLTAHPRDWPSEAMTMRFHFEQGKLVGLDDQSLKGPDMLRTLNARFGAYGVGRGVYTGDTTIGLKGRIVFEAPALVAMQCAHRALSECCRTNQQNAFTQQVAKKWVDLVYRGFFYEPLKADLEAFLLSNQQFVTGTVTLQTHGGVTYAVAVDSEHILRRKDAVYAQSADWSVTEAEGFIKLLGQSARLAHEVNPRFKL